MYDLTEVKTKDLLNELASRPGVEHITGKGTYSPYELRRRYSNNRETVNPDVVLVIENLDHLEA